MFQKYSTRLEKEEITNYMNRVLLNKEHTVKNYDDDDDNDDD
jgi:hypothetical protein